MHVIVIWDPKNSDIVDIVGPYIMENSGLLDANQILDCPAYNPEREYQYRIISVTPISNYTNIKK
jgi:hypothetical protein